MEDEFHSCRARNKIKVGFHPLDLQLFVVAFQKKNDEVSAESFEDGCYGRVECRGVGLEEGNGKGLGRLLCCD